MSTWKDKWTKAKWSMTLPGARKKKMQEAIAPLLQWPETRALVEFAAQQNIPITFSKDLINTDVAGHLHVDPKTGHFAISLSPNADSASLTRTLIHELRHAWQNAILGTTQFNMQLEAPDAATALFFTRVREADAYAFTNLMVTRIINSYDDDEEGHKIKARFTAANNGGALTETQQEILRDMMLERFLSRLPGQEVQMMQNFYGMLQNMDVYDRDALEDYHNRYTSPDRPTEARPQGEPLTTADARKILRLGVHTGVTEYFNHLSDAEFREMVTEPQLPAVKHAVGLIAAFEKAAAKGLDPVREQAYRVEVHRTVEAAIGRILPRQ